MEKDTYIYGQWGFPDSLHRKRAMYNWLDRYGEKQISINWLDNKRINPKNLLILFNANSIIEVQSKGKIELNKWMQFQKINFPKDSLRYVIEQPAGRKCTWYVAIKNKLIPCSQREVSTDPM
ncbi:MAG TPA: hypothetical protein DEF82_09195 [Crocinitomicaceae bacterium]|nr:hypothetical protein [Crocinitomicaceae bacterium]